VTDADGLASLEALRTVRTIVALDSPIQSSTWPIVPFNDLALVDDSPPEVTSTQTELMAILYTSGTTGSPKGCMLSHRYLMTIGLAYKERWLLGADDRIFSALPLFHAGGQLICLMSALVSGVSVAFE